MKGKLIKTDNGYILDGDNLPNLRRLSIQNCDEIFEVIDVYKLAKQKYPNVDNEDYEYDSEWEMLSDEYKKSGFIQGAKSILELNKHKLFTLDDIKKVITITRNDTYKRESIEEIIQSIQQPTEIEVEVVMDKIPADLAPGGWDVFPKLDSQGCLILKRVI
jgi:hypothetical protein